MFTTFGVLKVYKYISRLIIWFVSIISIIRFILDDYYHESGSIEVVKYRHILDHIERLGFVISYNSTPGQSYLHRNDISDLWSISCEPPLTLLDSKDISNKLSQYMDESDYFYDDIPNFVNKYFSDGKDNIDSIKSKEFNRIWPQYLVVFEHLDKKFLKSYFQNNNMYKEHKRFFNSLSHWDSRRSGDIIIYKKINTL